MALIRALPILLLFGCATTGRAPPPPASEGIALSVEGLPAGARVTVAGSFNHWDAAGPALREAAPGVYETFLRLAPGVHELQLVIRTEDGAERWLAPPGLPRYEPDGFGGENAVVEIQRNLRAGGSSFEDK